jgi:tetratricopeptide (TPR) repeat protein
MLLDRFPRANAFNASNVAMAALAAAFGLAVLASSLGCASPAPEPAVPQSGRARSDRARSNAETTVVVAPIVVSPYSEAELAAQFEQARALLAAEKYREAGAAFDRLLRLSPDGIVAPPSLFNRGIAHDGLGERDLGADRYRELLRRFPDHSLAPSARGRLLRSLGYLERWSELVTVADQVLAEPHLSVLQTIEARGARALGLVEQGLIDEASRDVMKARDLIEDHHLGQAGKLPIELAPVSFALGEVRKGKSEQIKLAPVPPNFTDVLEQRCQGLLDAQNAYTDAMRALDAHWSAMAGFRIGELYEQLHRDVMEIPPPAAATSLRKKQLFEGAMRLRYRVLLEKGLRMMDGVVRMAERTGEASVWIGRAKEARTQLERALADEKAALASLPFTEAELQEGLNALKGK